MDKIMEFLAQYYLYVALGSLGIIIILVLIIIIGNSKKKRKQKGVIANIPNMQMGVVNNVNQPMQPQGVAGVNQPMPINEVPQAQQAVNSMSSLEKSLTPSNEEFNAMLGGIPEPVSPVESPVQSAPVESVAPVEMPVQSAPVEPVSPVEAPVQSAPVEPVSPVEAPVESAPVEPVPEIEAPVVAEPAVVEPLEVFGVSTEEENPTPKGTAVAGFSSVNVEK